MIAHLVEVLLQGIWSSLTGGWFYDPHLSIFINTVHMYTWIFLFVLPFSFYILFPSNYLTWFIYSLIIFLTFTIIKLANYELNRMFDKNKIIVNEKLIRLPKVKLKTNKKRTKKTKTPRPILTNRAHVPSNALSEWQLDRNVADLNANSVGVQATSLNASRADSLVTSLKTMDLIGNAINETDSNFVNVFNTNDVNNSNLDASISSSIRQKSKSNSKNPSDNLVNLEYLFSDSVSKKSTKQDLENQSASSSQSNCSNKIESNEYEQIHSQKKKKDEFEFKSELISCTENPITDSNLNLEDQNLISVISSIQFNQKDLEENSNRSLFKISEESLHYPHAGAINSKKTKSSKKTKPVNEKKTYQTTVTSAPTVPSISFDKSQDSAQSSTWLNSNSYSELNSIKSRKASNKSISNQIKHTKPLIRRAKSDLSFSLFEKIIKKSQLNFKNQNPSRSRDDIEQNPNSIYESIDGESSKTLLHTCPSSSQTQTPQQKLKQSKTVVELFTKYKYDSESLEKKISFLTTQSFSKSLNESNWTSWKRLGAKSFQNLNSNTLIEYDQPGLMSLSQHIQYEDLKQFKSTLECIECNSFSLESIKKKFLSYKQDKIENEYQSILLGSNVSLKDVDLIHEYQKQGAVPKNRSSSFENRKQINRQRAGGRKRSNSKNRNRNSKSFSNIESEQSVFLINERSNRPNTRHRHRARSQNSVTRPLDPDKIISESTLSYQNRNLTLSASQAASAAAKLIKRDLLDRLKTRGVYRIEDGNVGDEEEEQESAIRFETKSNELNESNITKSRHRRRSSKFRQRNNQHEFGLVDNLSKDSKLTPLVQIKTNADLSNESEDGGVDLKIKTARAPSTSKPLTYEAFMDIIQMNEAEAVYENDDQISENEYELIKPFLSRARNSKSVHYNHNHHHNNHYRFNSGTHKNPEELVPMNRQSNFTRSRSVDNRSYESYSSSTRRHLIRSRLRFSNRRNHNQHQQQSRQAPNTGDSRSQTDPIDINAYHVILPNTDTNQTQESNTTDNEQEEKEVKKKFYKLPITKSLSLQIPFNHFSLLAMLDKNQSFLELVSTILIATLVSILTGLILNEQIYDDLFLVLFCFIVASCHYSLLKSVQPDSSSPIHGFNRLTALGRPIYFCLICSLILALRFLTLTSQTSAYYPLTSKILNLVENFSFYTFNLNKSKLECVCVACEIFLLFFPFIFTLGLFPQISTFTLCILEQIDMYIFGATAMNSLAGAFLSILRSIFSTIFLSLILFASLFTIPNVVNSIPHSGESIVELAAQQNQFSQSVLFSFYCALLVVVSYTLSRQSSDLVAYFALFKESILECKQKTSKKPIIIQKEPDSIQLKSLKTSSSGINDYVSISTSSSIHSSQDPPNKAENTNLDPFESNNKNLIKLRLESDLITCIFIFIFVFAIHVSTLFSVLKPWLNEILFISSICVGALNHYILPHLRLENPWYLFSQPLLKPKHWSVFEPNYLARLEWFEIIHLGFSFFEKNILNVLVILGSLTASADQILLKYKQIDSNGLVSCVVITIISLKLIRNSFCETSKQYKLFLIAYLFNKFDSKLFHDKHETILFDLFFTGIVLNKLGDFVNKLEFVYVYTAPWQLPWGSAFHAFAQPLSTPHTSLLFLQTFLSSLIGAPLMPLMGSAIFLLSYMRPVKFWEKNYKTKRVDNSNTRLQSQFDTTTPDSENLNSIFYEHLASVLQKSLCGDIMLGRWGNVNYGDFFVLSSDYLNCLVHIIEIGNGFVTFQLRGLEFKGTYCQQRELEAITEDTSENNGFCCCKLGHLKYMLSFNAAFHLRWVAWSVVSRKYIVDAYRIVDNDLSLIVNFYSLRRTLIDFYLKSAIFYSIKSPKLLEWLSNTQISKEMEKFNQNYADFDTCFDSNLDMDYDTQIKGLTVAKFNNHYSKWINHCKTQRLKEIKDKKSGLIKFLQDDSSYSLLIRFCFALSLVCRRALITACTGTNNNNSNHNHSHHHHNNNHTRVSTSGLAGTSSNLNNSLNSVGGIMGLGSSLHTTHLDTDSLSSFQHGYYTLFKGDIRIQSPKDEWVFNDMEILKKIALPAVRMGLRLHQDHFQNDSTDEATLFENLSKFDKESVICYERDPVWRRAVLSSVSNLLSLRHQFTEYSDQYKVVMLNKNFLSFRVIKINKECVRSFWASQQHELIFLRNKNQERGSIQNAKQVLRNIINSSCDQPIGYPIYVSPLITSYSSSHPQINRILGAEFKFNRILRFLQQCFHRIRNNCMNDCSGSADPNLNNLYAVNQSQNLNISYSTKNEALSYTNPAPRPFNQEAQKTQPIAETVNENNPLHKKTNKQIGLTSLVGREKDRDSIDSNSITKRPGKVLLSKVQIGENCEEKL